ncbi:MAG: hypothetical protein IJS27_04540, partial [Ruminococcus sp.]|nr:hypothetical protein [Ruminococcus sp.]
MKNKDVLLDVIGEVDDSLIPMHTKKRFSRSRAVIGGVLAAALIAGMILILPKGNRTPAVAPSATEAVSAQPSEGSATPTDAQEPTVLKIVESSVKALASAEYPAISAYLPGGSYDRTGFTSFFENSTQVFLSGAENDNRVYSPMSLFMALGMTAEATDGDSRQQILDALGQEDIDALRSYAKLLWAIFSTVGSCASVGVAEPSEGCADIASVAEGATAGVRFPLGKINIIPAINAAASTPPMTARLRLKRFFVCMGIRLSSTSPITSSNTSLFFIRRSP